MSSSQMLPPPQGPEYARCFGCGHIEPEHRPATGSCLVCDCPAYRPVPAVPTPSVGQAPATDQTPLRDRIAEALRTTPSSIGADNPQLGFPSHHQPGESGYLGWCALCIRDIDALADAVLAVLPATTDQTAVLSETERKMLEYALDLADEEIATDGSDFTDEEEDALAELRRIVTKPTTTEFELRGDTEIRATALREAADRLAELRAAEREWLPATGLHKGEQELRRMADETQPAAGARQDETQPAETQPAETERCAHCTHPKGDHDGRADHRAKHSPLVAGEPWCHACNAECDYAAAGARQDGALSPPPPL
ncbi:hypothetical protein [Streptomyces sp. NPDC059701]|uniref:hypothetical protein n=1 Tax=Streptomyces sp. NPDC059701 TaxID=3346914 RepID=UPI0036994B97